MSIDSTSSFSWFYVKVCVPRVRSFRVARNFRSVREMFGNVHKLLNVRFRSIGSVQSVQSAQSARSVQSFQRVKVFELFGQLGALEVSGFLKLRVAHA